MVLSSYNSRMRQSVCPDKWWECGRLMFMVSPKTYESVEWSHGGHIDDTKPCHREQRWCDMRRTTSKSSKRCDVLPLLPRVGTETLQLTDTSFENIIVLQWKSGMELVDRNVYKVVKENNRTRRWGEIDAAQQHTNQNEGWLWLIAIAKREQGFIFDWIYGRKFHAPLSSSPEMRNLVIWWWNPSKATKMILLFAEYGEDFYIYFQILYSKNKLWIINKS